MSSSRRTRRSDAVPKVLTDTQVQSFQRDGFLSPVRAMSAERARHCRERFESLEARVADIKKMKTKSHLLCPWVLDIAEDPYILDIFEDLIGPNLRCWSMAWRVKKADGETFAGWHQDSFYGSRPGRPRCPRALRVRQSAGVSARHSRLAQVGDPSPRGDRRSQEHPRPRPVHHRAVRRVGRCRLRAASGRDGDVRQLARPRVSGKLRA